MFGLVLFCVVIRFNLCLALGFIFVFCTKIHVATRVRVVVCIELGLLLLEVIWVFSGQWIFIFLLIFLWELFEPQWNLGTLESKGNGHGGVVKKNNNNRKRAHVVYHKGPLVSSFFRFSISFSPYVSRTSMAGGSNKHCTATTELGGKGYWQWGGADPSSPSGLRPSFCRHCCH